jgi:small ligand-binding sensory domain FIST
MICGGTIPVGSTLQVAINERDDILQITGGTIDTLLKDAEDASGVLIYSCVTRSMTMGINRFDEVSLINSKIGNNLPVFLAYSGGEICPTTSQDDKAINRFHNNTLIACLF